MSAQQSMGFRRAVVNVDTHTDRVSDCTKQGRNRASRPIRIPIPIQEFEATKRIKSENLTKHVENFKNLHPKLVFLPSLTPVMGDRLTTLDIMEWFRKTQAPNSVVLVGQGEMPILPLPGEKPEKNAPFYPLSQVLAGKTKVIYLLGECYTASVLHKEVRRYPTGPCIRNNETRWFTQTTTMVWVDVEMVKDGVRVQPTADELAGLISFCIKEGAAAITISPHGIHALLIFNNPVPVGGKSPAEMRAAVTYFFRNFNQDLNPNWKIDIDASANRARQERVCEVVFWDKNAEVQIPPEIIASPIEERKSETRTKPQKLNKVKTGGSFAGSHKAGRDALRIRREALHYCGVKHITKAEFIAQVADTVCLTVAEVKALFEKFPVGGEAFGPLTVYSNGREILPGAEQWKSQKTKKQFASMAWIYTILHGQSGCTAGELHTLFAGLLVRPLVSPYAAMVPEALPFPPHILMPVLRPQKLLEEAVLKAFGITKNELVNSPNDSQVLKALATLELITFEPYLEERLCQCLDHCNRLHGPGFLSWLKADIERCSIKYWGKKPRIASKQRIRMVLDAIGKLAKPAEFSTAELRPLVKGMCTYGYKKRKPKKSKDSLLPDTKKKTKVRQPRKKNKTQALFRVLTQMVDDGVLVRNDAPQPGKNRAGRASAKWSVASTAMAEGKVVKTYENRGFIEGKECFKQYLVKDNEGILVDSVGATKAPKLPKQPKPPKIPKGKGVKLSIIALDNECMICASHRDFKTMMDKLEVVVCGVRGVKSNNGESYWVFKALAETNNFDWGSECFSPFVLANGWVNVRGICIPQFSMPKFMVPDGSGSLTQLKPDGCYTRETFKLKIGAEMDKKESVTWLTVKPMFDQQLTPKAPTDQSNSKAEFLNNLFAAEAEKWLRANEIVDKKRKTKKLNNEIIERTAIEASQTQDLNTKECLCRSAAEKITEFYTAVPADMALAIVRICSDKPTIMLNLVKGLQAIRKKESKQNNNVIAKSLIRN